ncbi:MAG: leucine-rich repeat domain-containing protein [Oscillospiraceae bacterium]|nr:leucine-rich repeat domain-containing protein [Oscillospiraceae bacterium]
MEITLRQAEKDFVLRRKHGKIHIKKYIGTGGKVVIPSFIDGMPVTKTEQWLFHGSDITEVVIPETLRYIGNGTFIFCKLLRKVTFCSKVYIGAGAFHFSGLEEISGIGYIAGGILDRFTFSETPFYNNTEEFIVGDFLIWYHGDKEVYTVPPHIKKIGFLAFRDSKVKSLILPDGLKEISNLFLYGSGIRSLHIPDSVEKVGRGSLDLPDLEDITLPEDFARRKGWQPPLGLKIPVINDTQVMVDKDGDVLEYENVSCIFCRDNRTYRYSQREKQIFPERLEYLRDTRLFSLAFINVFKNDTFKVGDSRRTFDSPFIFPTQYKDGRRRFRFIFDLKDSYGEVLMFFPVMPYGAWSNPQPALADFYNACLTNGRDGKFLDLELYDGHILEQDIPFRIKAEIAFLRCTSGYRLTEASRNNYREYFRFHRKKLHRLLQKDGYGKMKIFFDDFTGV